MTDCAVVAVLAVIVAIVIIERVRVAPLERALRECQTVVRGIFSSGKGGK